MGNVKHTTNNGEILTTNCKRVETALKRFTTFLSGYDNYYNVMLNKINSANDNNTTTFTDDSYNTVTMTLTVNDNNDKYTLTIKHTHNAPQTIWCICTQDGTVKEFTDRKDLFTYAYKNDMYGDFDNIWIEEKELKDERFDYYETVDYEEIDLYKVRTVLEFDICDMKIDSTNNDTTNTNEITTDSTTKTDTTANINNVLESLGNKQLIRKYVDGINNGLQNDSYKQTRECFCKLVQILPDGYEICFTTKFNVDMTKVDEPIYNHRYKIIRDKTGIMFNIHKYSEVEHKFKPMLSSMEITDIPLYIYHRTFDSVCCVFKHDSTLEIITKLEKLFDTAEKYKNSYTWNKDNGNAQQREWKEKHDSIDKFEWYDNGDKYTAEYTVQISRYNVYTYGAYTKNGKKTTLTAIKNSYNRLLKAVKRE